MYKVEQNRPVEPDTKVLDVNVFGVIFCKPLHCYELEPKVVGLLTLY